MLRLLIVIAITACGPKSKVGESCAKSDDCESGSRCIQQTCINFCYVACNACKEYIYSCGHVSCNDDCPGGSDCLDICARDGWEGDRSRMPKMMQIMRF